MQTKTRVAFMVRVRFAAVNRVRRDGLVCHLWLKHRSSLPLHEGGAPRAERLDPSLVLRSEAELDDEFRGWMREAYDVGRQAHLAR